MSKTKFIIVHVRKGQMIGQSFVWIPKMLLPGIFGIN